MNGPNDNNVVDKPTAASFMKFGTENSYPKT